jgi:hypothetical protein
VIIGCLFILGEVAKGLRMGYTWGFMDWGLRDWIVVYVIELRCSRWVIYGGIHEMITSL